jgi:hypothetical protein
MACAKDSANQLTICTPQFEEMWSVQPADFLSVFRRISTSQSKASIYPSPQGLARSRNETAA